MFGGATLSDPRKKLNAKGAIGFSLLSHKINAQVRLREAWLRFHQILRAPGVTSSPLNRKSYTFFRTTQSWTLRLPTGCVAMVKTVQPILVGAMLDLRGRATA